MKTLLWKDFRQNRRFLVVAAVFLVIPYAFILCVGIGEQFAGHHSFRGHWLEYFHAAALTAVGLSVLLTAFIAGNAIAGERADRSAEFAAYLPISRTSAVTSKALLAFGVCLFICLINILTFHATVPVDGNWPGPDTREVISVAGLTALCMFGVAWLFSALLTSPAMAAIPGLLAPLLLVLGLSFIEMAPGPEWVSDSIWWYLVLCSVLGLACFAAGTLYYLRRVEP